VLTAEILRLNFRGVLAAEEPVDRNAQKIRHLHEPVEVDLGHLPLDPHKLLGREFDLGADLAGRSSCAARTPPQTALEIGSGSLVSCGSTLRYDLK
jgi:hypothetical protein